jgi:hypothetical protein
MVQYESEFFTSCVSVATQQEGNGSPVSPTVTLVSLNTTAFSDLDLAKDVPNPDRRPLSVLPRGYL